MFKHVLVVEDDEDQRELMREILEILGHRVCVACDGCDALHQLLNAALPALIFLDITMPLMSGQELLEELSQFHPELAAIPIVVISAVSDFAQIAGRYDAVVAILKKPLKIETLQLYAGRYAS